MKTIILTSSGSARVDRDSDQPPSVMNVRYRLWQLEDGRLAYVRRTMETRDTRTRPKYLLSDRHGRKDLRPEEWRARKAEAKRTDAMAEAGSEGVQLINAALQGRLSCSDAVRQIENRSLQTTLEQQTPHDA